MLPTADGGVSLSGAGVAVGAGVGEIASGGARLVEGECPLTISPPPVLPLRSSLHAIAPLMPLMPLIISYN